MFVLYIRPGVHIARSFDPALHRHCYAVDAPPDSIVDNAKHAARGNSLALRCALWRIRQDGDLFTQLLCDCGLLAPGSTALAPLAGTVLCDLVALAHQTPFTSLTPVASVLATFPRIGPWAWLTDGTNHTARMRAASVHYPNRAEALNLSPLVSHLRGQNRSATLLPQPAPLPQLSDPPSPLMERPPSRRHARSNRARQPIFRLGFQPEGPRRRRRSFREKRPRRRYRGALAAQRADEQAWLRRRRAAACPSPAEFAAADRDQQQLYIARFPWLDSSNPDAPAHPDAPQPPPAPDVEAFGVGVQICCSFSLVDSGADGLQRVVTGGTASSDTSTTSKQLDKLLEAWSDQCMSLAAVTRAQARVNRAAGKHRDAAQRQSFASRSNQLLIGTTCNKQHNEPLANYVFALRVSHDSARVAHERISYAQLLSLRATEICPGSRVTPTSSVYGQPTLFQYACLSPNTLLDQHAEYVHTFCKKSHPIIQHAVTELGLPQQGISALVETVTDFMCTCEGFWRREHVQRLASGIPGAGIILDIILGQGDSSASASIAERKQYRLTIALMKKIAVLKRHMIREVWRTLASARPLSNLSQVSMVARSSQSTTLSSTP